jgi:hypothetical protein
MHNRYIIYIYIKYIKYLRVFVFQAPICNQGVLINQTDNLPSLVYYVKIQYFSLSVLKI